MKSLRILALTAILGSVLLSACQQEEPEATPVATVEQAAVGTATVAPEPTAEAWKPEGEIVIAISTEIDSLEPARASEAQAKTVGWQMYDALVFSPWYGEPEPALAESWEISEDGTEYTLHLRRDVVFHNGEPFTADAVIFTWETYREGDVAESHQYAEAISVEKTDDYTVVMKTAEPNALFLITLGTSWSILPPEYYQEVGAEGFAEHPVGTGPFMFEEQVRGDHVTMVANPNYWRENVPSLAKVTFKPIPDSATRVAALQTGQIDLAQRLTSEEAERLKENPEIEIVTYISDRPCYVSFNNKSTGIGTPIADPRVRLAFNHAIDVQSIIDVVFQGFAERSAGFVTPANAGFDNGAPFPYDPEKAKQLLAEAGYPDGFEIDFSCPDQAYVHINEVCEAVVGYLAEVGITANLEMMESTRFWDMQLELTAAPTFIDCWGGFDNEAYQRLKPALGKDEAWSMWYDETLAAMIDEIPTIIDYDTRMQQYSEIQKYMRENPPFAYLHLPKAFDAVNSRIAGFEPSPNEHYFVWKMSLAK